METILLFLVVVVAVVVMVAVVQSKNSPSSIASYLSSLSGSLVLVNTDPISVVADNQQYPVLPTFTTVSSVTYSLFSYDSSNNQISILKSGNYLVTLFMSPEDNIIVNPNIFVFPSLTFFSNTNNKAVLYISQAVIGVQAGAQFSYTSTSVVYLSAGQYNLNGVILISSNVGNPDPFYVSTGKASFTVATIL